MGTDARPADLAVLTRNLRKSFRMKGKSVEAVRGVSLQVRTGEIYGLLGPNGAGKTTTLRMLTTLLPIDDGEAWVAGADVRRQPGLVRRRIGYVGQLGGADLPATGRENLILQGQLYHLPDKEVGRRADELIDLLDLSVFVDRPARTYSGGQRRRLEVALGLMHRPEVLFLDEPTTGLDPQNRANLWDQLRALRDGGTTIVLTTHYLEEADALADRVAIVDHGQIVAEDSPGELKRQLGGDTTALKPRRGAPALLSDLHRVLSAEPFVRDARLEGETVRLYVADGARDLPVVFERLRSFGVELEFVQLAEPSLDDVFLQKTGRTLRDVGQPEVAA
jgi:ABC-2 type transport system ATP-binding protein